MITENQIKYYEHLNSEYWQNVSEAVKARAGWRCQVCNSENDLCAHHRTYEHRGNEMEHLSDLICMCKSCHEIFHHVQRIEKTRKPQKQAGSVDVFVSAGKIDAKTKTRVLNQETIQSLMVSGGMTSATLKAIGHNWSFTRKSGWINRLRGLIITEDAYQAALLGKKIKKNERMPIQCVKQGL